MEKMRRMLSRLPAGLFSGITLIAILWLTLAPKPLGENPPPLFPGADKIAHGIMFGGLAAMFLLDYQRRHGWHRIGLTTALFAGAVAFAIGVGIEFAQLSMGLGRGFEIEDIIADGCGGFIAPLIWIGLQKNWIET